MPVFKKTLSKEEVIKLLIAGQDEQTRIKNTTQLKDDGIILPQKARMIKNPFLARMEEKYAVKLQIHKQAD